MYEFNIFSMDNASPNFLDINIARESCKTEDSDSVGLGYMSNILCDFITGNLRIHYTHESITLKLAVVKCLLFKSHSSLRVSHLLKL